MASSNNPVKRRALKTQQARNLRQAETEAEYRLWGDLRNRLLNGYKFTRQVPLGPYIVDFLCRDQRLIVEIDGSQHAESERDDRRTEWLNRQGYTVIRFWNHEVLKERRSVLETILAALEDKLGERCEATRFFPAKVEFAAPSSGPSDHLIPAGEKGEQAALANISSPPRGEGPAGVRRHAPEFRYPTNRETE